MAEGMIEINNTEPIKIIGTDKVSIEIELDSTNFSDYWCNALVEKVKVA